MLGPPLQPTCSSKLLGEGEVEIGYALAVNAASASGAVMASAISVFFWLLLSTKNNAGEEISLPITVRIGRTRSPGQPVQCD